MRVLLKCNIPQLKFMVNGVALGRTESWCQPTFKEKSKFYRQGNLRFDSHYSEAYPFRTRLHQEASTWRGRQRRRFAIAMDKMEITDEQIREEKQRIEQEEMFLGKEELPEGADANVNGRGPKVGAVGPELLEVWDLWQRIGLPVAKIAKQRHMTETGVFYCIFTCIQNNYTVDWYELCKEAQFTLKIAKRMIQATEKLVAHLNGGPVDSRTLRRHLPDDVSDVHFGLFATMLVRGLTFETIREISFHTGGDKPEMEWGEEYADEERFPKEVNERNLLQWFAEKDGASMIEIALKFRECDDLELMRLVLKLEEENKIFWRQGIFRVIKTK
ncbi:unnamed protein product [Calypogeia fissa]